MPWGERVGGRTALVLIGTALIGIFTGTGTLILYRFLSAPGSPPLALPSGVLLVSVFVSVASSSLAITFAVFALRHRDGVDEVFLVHEGGLLLLHFSKTLKAEKDRDVVVAMLTAVQSFILEAFAKGATGDLRQMDFGDRRILLRKGSKCYLAVVVRGTVPRGFTRRMRRALTKVEQAYGTVIGKWDGGTERLAGADDLLQGELTRGGLDTLARDLVDWVAGLARWRPWGRREKTGAPNGASTERPREDPRETAGGLLARSELDGMRAGYRELIETALGQIEEGRFTLAGVTNVYLAMALQKAPRASISGWWDEVLRTVRAVLQTWPWDPATQAWVQEGAVPFLPQAGPGEASLVAPAILPVDRAPLRRSLLSRHRTPDPRTKNHKPGRQSGVSRGSSRT